jgi:Na+-transporting NADH:ubiquinone oxidoreductase subunit NqrC
MMPVMRRTKASSPVVMILVLGFVGISLLHLLLTIATSQSVYELADLKREKRELDATSQILAEQVLSLSSNQNLYTTASRLGMVVNTNPVFLRLNDQAILGQPRPAAGTSIQSTNLVANSVMIVESTQINQETVPASSSEPTQISSESQTISSMIPVSPTR